MRPARVHGPHLGGRFQLVEVEWRGGVFVVGTAGVVEARVAVHYGAPVPYVVIHRLAFVIFVVRRL